MKKYKIKLKYTKPFSKMSAVEKLEFMNDVESQWAEKRTEWRNDHKVYLIIPIICFLFLAIIPHLNISNFITLKPYLFFVLVLMAISSGFIYAFKFADRGF